jgi:hypothetical protein
MKPSLLLFSIAPPTAPITNAGLGTLDTDTAKKRSFSESFRFLNSSKAVTAPIGKPQSRPRSTADAAFSDALKILGSGFPSIFPKISPPPTEASIDDRSTHGNTDGTTDATESLNEFVTAFFTVSEHTINKTRSKRATSDGKNTADVRVPYFSCTDVI